MQMNERKYMIEIYEKDVSSSKKVHEISGTFHLVDFINLHSLLLNYLVKPLIGTKP